MADGACGAGQSEAGAEPFDVTAVPHPGQDENCLTGKQVSLRDPLPASSVAWLARSPEQPAGAWFVVAKLIEVVDDLAKAETELTDVVRALDGVHLAHGEPAVADRHPRHVRTRRRLDGLASLSTFRAPDSRSGDYAAVELLAAVLGRGRGSRLYRKLGARGISRSARMPLGVGPGPRGSGVHQHVQPARRRRLGGVEYEFLTVLNSLADGSVPVSEPELGRAKALLTSDWLSSVSELSGRADMLGQYAMLQGDPRAVRDQLRRLDLVTADDVQRMAGLVFPEENGVVVEYAAVRSGE